MCLRLAGRYPTPRARATTTIIADPRIRPNDGGRRNPSTTRPSHLLSRGRSSSISGSPGSCLPSEVRRFSLHTTRERVLTIVCVPAEALATTSPLMTKALLQFLVDAYAHHSAPSRFPDAPPVGKGIGYAVGLFAMQGTWAYIEPGRRFWFSEMLPFAELGSLCRNQAQQYGMQVGVLTRSAVREFRWYSISLPDPDSRGCAGHRERLSQISPSLRKGSCGRLYGTPLCIDTTPSGSS